MTERVVTYFGVDPATGEEWARAAVETDGVEHDTLHVSAMVGFEGRSREQAMELAKRELDGIMRAYALAEKAIAAGAWPSTGGVA